MTSLLETISSDEQFARRLAEMPADAKTLTIQFELSRPVVHHPHWEIDLHGVNQVETNGVANGLLNQTVDVAVSNESFRASEGFIPPRRVATLCTPNPNSSDDIEYRLIGKLGSGGTGIVYQAHQRAIDREVAVKVLRHELAADPQARQRFLAEARVIGALDHPNVIALHDLCLDDAGHLFYSMKRIDGASWDQQIETLGEEKNIDILLRVADAIRYAHSRGLIHRDLKPENVMLGRFGEVLVADWGLAVERSDDAAPLGGIAAATESAIGGTPAYMAPELAGGGVAAIGVHTDVYLLGAILFQILTGRPPHHGESLLHCIRNAAENVIIQTDVDGELMDVALQAMATKPADRYATVDEFVAEVTSQRAHAASERLVRRAHKQLSEPESDDQENPYRRYRIAEALYREALEIWPRNRRAIVALKSVQIDFARIAASRGDLDLALLLYENSGAEDSEAAALVRLERQRRAEVSQSHAKYSTLFTNSPDAGLLIRWDDGVVMEANDACLELLGYAEDELVGRTMAELQVWACPSRRRLFVEQLGRDGWIDNFEAQFVPRETKLDSPICPPVEEAIDGDEVSEIRVASQVLIDVLISSRTVEVDGQRMLLSTIRDISPRKAAERQLQQSQRRLRDLQRLAGLGSWSYDVQTKQVSWSEETFRVTGRSTDRGEPGYTEFMQLIHPNDRAALGQAIASAINVAASYQMNIRMLDDDGLYRNLLTRGQPVLNAAGQVTEVYGVLMSSPGGSRRA